MLKVLLLSLSRQYTVDGQYIPSLFIEPEVRHDKTSYSGPVYIYMKISEYPPFQGGTSFVDHLCFLCLVYLMLSHLFIAALWSPAGKGLTSLLLSVMFIVFLLLSHMVSWVRCGT